MGETATINVSKELRQKLKILVAKKNMRNYDELIRELIKKEDGDLKR